MLSLKLPDEMKQRLKEESKKREMSVSALIRWIIKQYFLENSSEEKR